ncbi:MAG TPA: hypothetical protein DHI91_01450 [Candidatus Portnoybacteria bacterium]|nr:hypothetical protein [Candidatus Portnoybacteria bacterium]
MDHSILLSILREYISDKNIINLLAEVIGSFSSGQAGVGLPLGNLTSQLLVNIYLNKFDQFVKHKLKAKYYLRYADDFVIFAENKQWLEAQIFTIQDFLRNKLKLQLHPDKVFIKTLSAGVDFLGVINFTGHRVLRTKTKRRMFKKLQRKKRELDNGLMTPEPFKQSLQSYLGTLTHCNGYKLKQQLLVKFS